MNSQFTFILLGQASYATENYYGTLAEAEKRFDELIDAAIRYGDRVRRAGADIDTIYFYGPDGAINSWRKP